MRLNTTWLIFVTTLMLMTLGIVMVYSSSAAIAAQKESNAVAMSRGSDSASVLQSGTHSTRFLKRQTLWAALSVIGMLLIYRIDYQTYVKYATPLIVVSAVALVLVFVPHIGAKHNGARRWINLILFEFQPSELTKLALIIFMAKKLEEHRQQLKSFWDGFVPPLAILGAFLIAIVLEPDLGTTVVIGMIVFSMWFVGGMRIVHLATLFIAAIPCLVIAILVEPYRVARLMTFLKPETDIHNTGYHLYQSLVSVGSGGIWGVGLGCGPQKYLFLSEAHTDFIFAMICEELGMVGALAVVLLYSFFIIQGIRIAVRIPDMFGALLATGVTAMIGLQAYINMAVVLGLVPTKGLTLPLISYGGSSLFINALAIGILMNVSRHAEYAASPSRPLRLAIS